MDEHEDRFQEELQEPERTAAAWTARMDRGLTADEQDQLSEWLAADPLHREFLRRSLWSWNELDRLAGLQTTLQARADPDLLAPRSGFFSMLTRIRRSRLRIVAFPVAAAVLLTSLLVFSYWPGDGGKGSIQDPPFALVERIEQRMLPDGSRIELNRGASIEVAYSPGERRVYLIRGEAVFTVEKDPLRPFIVDAGGVDVEAVGTVFNVRFGDDRVDVIVSEGTVSVQTLDAGANVGGDSTNSVLELRQRAIVDLSSLKYRLEVLTLNESELEAELRWRPQLLDFDAAPLSVIVAEFNRRNPVQISIEDPELQSVGLSSAFWSDNVDGFVRLMESSFGMKAEWRGTKTIVLRKRTS